jgi:hypothetical protein
MFVPPPWLSRKPEKHSGQRPCDVQVNVLLPPDTSQADTATLMQGAQAIVDGNSNWINRWLGVERNRISQSNQGYSSRRLRMDGMDATWSINNGVEKLSLDVYPATRPSGGEDSSDINTDGYCLWTHFDPGFPDIVQSGSTKTRTAPTPWNIFFNGYLIEENFPIVAGVTMYPILFGKTALLCQSYTGSKDGGELNPLVRETMFTQPHDTIPFPGWGSYQAGSAPDGTAQDKMPKELGYWLFDYYNVHNPCQYVKFGQFWEQIKLLLSGVPGSTSMPTMTKGMYIKNSSGQFGKDTILRPRAKNGMSVMLSPLSSVGFEVTTIDVFMAEFYDRGKFRKVSQSWTHRQANGVISINDSPLIYGSGQLNLGQSSGGGMLFNLDPTYTKNGPTGDDSLLGPHDGANTWGDQHSGLNDDQIKTIDDWIAACDDVIAPWNTQHLAKLSQLLQKIDDPAQQQKVVYAEETAFIVRTFLNDPHLYIDKPGALDDYWPADIRAYQDPTDPTGKTIKYPLGKTGDTPTPPITWTMSQVQQVTSRVKTTDSTDPDHPIVTDDYVYGPDQAFYLVLPPASGKGDATSLVTYFDNALTGALAHSQQWVAPEYTAKQTGHSITGEGTTHEVETWTFEIDQDDNYSFLAFADDYLGPFNTAQQLVLAGENYISNIMAPYELLLKQYDDEINAKPPDLPPFPNLGTSLSDLGQSGYSNITVDGAPTGQWSFNQ